MLLLDGVVHGECKNRASASVWVVDDFGKLRIE